MRLALFGLALATLCSALPAYAGPPFQTDDPEPIDYRHIEMYAFELSDSTGKRAGGTVLETPAYEVNYGPAPNLHLHLVVPLTAVFQPGNGPTNFGIGDTEVGFKYRFLQETKHVPQVGIFPFFELPSGSYDKGLGVGSIWYRMPMWAQKSWGPKDTQWTTYGGGGAVVMTATGYNNGFKNYPFAGWLLQKQLNEKLTLGGELFGHGAEGEAATSTRASTMLDLGGIYEFHDGFDLLFCAGRSVYGQPETYTYLAAYWTWGVGVPSEEGDKDSGEKSGGTGSKMLSALTHFRPH